MNHEAARTTVAEIEAAGVEASRLVVDVGDEKMLTQMFASVRERFRRLDIFVSNAARTAFDPAPSLSVRSWRRIQEINSQAFLVGAQRAASIMRENGGGRIIGISSLGSRYFVPNYAGLGAAKAAIEALARYLAVEFADWKVNVNVVCAGLIDSDAIRMLPDYKAVLSHAAERTPVHRVGQPEDVAGVVALLCQPDSDWIRGQTIIADGGYSLIG
jgi:NAD(P)-dependent dehydrogenase (short-subunit alcohol dehydrogenase family)